MTRKLYATGLLVCLGSLAFAYLYLENVLGLIPCPLCILDRIVLAVLAALFLIALLHNPNILGSRIFAGMATLFSLGGVGLAARHIYLQNLPPEQVPGCLPEFAYMLKEFPLLDLMETVLGAGECAHVSWTFAGLTIPQQTFGVFLLLTILSAALFFVKKS